MQKLYQLDLFDSNDVEEIFKNQMETRIIECEESINKVRKGLFARQGALEKLLIEMRNELEFLKRNI